VAQHEHTRECLLLLEAILETPGLGPRLAEVLRPKKQGSGNRDHGSDKRDQRSEIRDREDGRGGRQEEAHK
jgi:hypothetical protein